MDAGTYEVVVDYTGMQARVNVNSLLEDEELLLLPELLSFSCPIFSTPSSFWLYFITPVQSPQEYIMRLPPECSLPFFLGLQDVYLEDTPVWYTFGNPDAPSIIALSFQTTSSEAQVTEAVQRVATWADTVVTWLPPSTLNLARIVCSTAPLLSRYSESNDPVWSISPDVVSAQVLLSHGVSAGGRGVADSVPSEVHSLLSDTHSYSALSRLPELVRTHIEKRVTPLPSADPRCLTTGDCVIYLSPTRDQLVTTTVREVRDNLVLLENNETPEFLAKYDCVKHECVTELQPLSSFMFG